MNELNFEKHASEVGELKLKAQQQRHINLKFKGQIWQRQKITLEH